MAKKILVVDNEEDLVETLKKRLQTNGYEVLTATNGNEALNQVRQNRPDLIVLDVMMPGMDGVQLAQTLRLEASTKTIPIIFLTALQSKEEEQTVGDRVSGQIILAKPFEAKKLLQQIETIFNS